MDFIGENSKYFGNKSVKIIINKKLNFRKSIFKTGRRLKLNFSGKNKKDRLYRRPFFMILSLFLLLRSLFFSDDRIGQSQRF